MSASFSDDICTKILFGFYYNNVETSVVNFNWILIFMSLRILIDWNLNMKDESRSERIHERWNVLICWRNITECQRNWCFQLKRNDETFNFILLMLKNHTDCHENDCVWFAFQSHWLIALQCALVHKLWNYFFIPFRKVLLMKNMHRMWIRWIHQRKLLEYIAIQCIYFNSTVQSFIRDYRENGCRSLHKNVL